MNRASIAIIGAGVAGLAAAWGLRDSGLRVEVFEKSRGVSGRAASRTRHGARFDFGANYLKLEDPQVEELVLRQLSRADLVQIEGDVWTFDRAGVIAPGDPAHNRQAKWTYSSGISTLGKHLASAAGVAPRRSTRIVGLNRAQDGWRLQFDGDSGPDPALYDAVLLTAPGPQAIDLLAASHLPGVAVDVLDSALRQAEYHPQWCFALGFRDPLPARPPCFALINTDRGHDIAWLSFENDKPGRDLGGSTVVMVQMSPDWSAQHLQASGDELHAAVLAATLELLGLPDHPLAWHDSQRWLFAHPFRAADAKVLQQAEGAGLYFAGDALVGKGRAGEAMATGLRAAQRILAAL